MAVPYTFGSATSAIPLSQLDSNFATAITLGNTAIQLGNTVTTLNNMTLANVTVSSGNVTVTSVTDSGLTAGRVNYNGTGGLLVDSANLTFDGTNLGLAGGTANGIAYLNGSKVLTTGSALVFDGTNLGIGTSSFDANWSPKLQVTSTAADGTGGILIESYRPSLIFKDDSASAVRQHIVADNSTLMFGSGDASFTERMRIDSSGNLLVGLTSDTTTPASGLEITPNNGASQIRIGHLTGTATGNYYASFSYSSGIIGSIAQNGTTGVLYNITSDYRLKNNPTPVTNAKDFVMGLQPKTWDWWDGSGKGVGFIAHEFMEVAKYSGHGEKDAVDADGKPVYQTIQPSSSEVMANLVSFIQELNATITDLQAKLKSAGVAGF